MNQENGIRVIQKLDKIKFIKNLNIFIFTSPDKIFFLTCLLFFVITNINVLHKIIGIFVCIGGLIFFSYKDGFVEKVIDESVLIWAEEKNLEN